MTCPPVVSPPPKPTALRVDREVADNGSFVCKCEDYISITIVQSYTGKYHEFVAVCIVTSAQHE